MVPVLLLTGFLGSGKTTLLNRLMQARPPTTGRLAIVVNEFGDVGIDGDLLPKDMTRQVELPGGCICCVLNEDLDRTLIELIESWPDLETIVIETTGVAEPLPIAWSFDRDPLCQRFRLAAIVTVVDALEHERHRPLSPSVDAQVEYADILVISKLDLVAGDIPRSLLDAVRARNEAAPIVTGTPSEIADRLWLTLTDPSIAEQRRAADAQTPTHTYGHRLPHGIETIGLPIEQTLDFEELASLLAELPANYIRIKGIARVIDESVGAAEPHMVAFHRVGARVSSEPISGTPRPRLVALGTNIDGARLAACLQAAVVRCPDEGPTSDSD